ncbi:site-specific integrase [Candidatus Bathyarchaeota archaeon]|nr:MAG: site-specific integrase [Candidatus Bathyarchaeota archaeon]
MAEAEGKGFHKQHDCASSILDEKRLNNGKLDHVQPHPPKQPQLRCPECGSKKIWRDGLRYLKDGSTIQRWLCRACGFRFSQSTANSQVKINISRQVLKQPNSGKNLLQPDILQSGFSLKPTSEDPPFKSCEHIASHTSSKKTIAEKVLNTFADYNRERQVCAALTRGAKNLAESGTRQKEPTREGTAQTADVKGKIVEFMWKMQKNGRKLSTIKNYGKVLNALLNSGVNLLDVEEVKGYLARAKIKPSSKKQYTDTLKMFYKTLDIQWQPPKYKAEPEIPFIPTEKELDQFIAAVGKKLGTFLQLLKETGARAGEIQRLTWADIDFKRRTVRIKPLKGSLPRILPISLKAIEMLKNLPKKSERIFAKVIYGTFGEQRRNAAKKLGNPRILQIHFHTFRHWKATMEYHKTKDIIYVKQLLGHKNIQNTLIYITIEKALFQHGLDEEFHVRVAQKPEEIKALLEAGFEYVLQKDGLAFFRKRK